MCITNIGEKLYKEICLPITVDKDEKYLPELENTYKKFFDVLGEFNFTGDTSDKIKKNCDDIIKAIKLYKNAQLIQARNIILKILETYKNNKFVLSDVNESYAFNAKYTVLDKAFLRRAVYQQN